MSNLIILNIGHDIADAVVRLLQKVEKMRSETTQNRLLLWPVSYALRVIKVAATYFAQGGAQARQHSIPDAIVSLRTHFATATPNSVYCFNKIGFLIFFADIYFI